MGSLYNIVQTNRYSNFKQRSFVRKSRTSQQRDFVQNVKFILVLFGSEGCVKMPMAVFVVLKCTFLIEKHSIGTLRHVKCLINLY